MPSGQQYQPTLGQQPPGQGVPSHCLGAAIFESWSSWQQMGNQQRWQRSTCHQGSSTSQHWGNSLQGMVFRHIVRLLSIEHLMHWQQPEKREQSSTSSWMKYGLLLPC